MGIFAQQQYELQAQRQIVRARLHGPVHEVHVIQSVVARPAVSAAILFGRLVSALNHERPQDRVAIQVQRDRHLAQRRTRALQHPRRLTHGRVHRGHRLGVAEALGEDAYPQAADAIFEAGGCNL